MECWSTSDQRWIGVRRKDLTGLATGLRGGARSSSTATTPDSGRSANAASPGSSPGASPGQCLHSLEQHRDRQLQEREAAGTGWKDSGYVFTRPNSAPVEGSTLTWHFNTLLRQARLRRIRFHDLRHSTATLLLEQGVELVVIKELLGHALAGVTVTVHAHVRLRLQRDAIDPLGHALRNPAEITGRADDGDEPRLVGAPVR